MNNMKFLTTSETAKILKIKPRAVHELREKKILPGYRVGKKILFKKEDIKNAIKPA
jgi:excisionase family DNA binding protein